jgi:predicted Zn finger-like uncharacterized protein
MLIVCPHCATSYLVEAPALGPAGRKVRCARCKTQWFATLPNPAAAAYADEIIAEANQQAAAASAASPPNHPATDSFDAPPLSASQEEDLARIRAALEGIALTEPIAESELAESELATTDPASPAAPDAVTADGAPEAPTIVIEAPPLVPPVEPTPHAANPKEAAPEEEEEEENIEHFTARQARQRAARRRRERSMQIPALIVALTMIVGAILLWRNDLVRHLPQTASLFSAIGLPVNVRGLVFDQVTVSRESSDDISVLVIEGHVVSISSKPVDVPRLRFSIRNTAGTEIYSWTAQPERNTLNPGETMPFRSRLASPPTDGNDVVVRFLNQHDLATGMK